MPKYYIKSGDIKFIIDTRDPESAILAALCHYKNKKHSIGAKICISEKGFESFKNWDCYDTSNFIKK